jgi:prophage antirepressor-like protein
MEQKITDNYHTYSSIPNTKNILSILVDNINGNDLFQKHVTKLSSSNKSVDIKKAQVIKNTIQNIKVFNTNMNPLILAKDIGILVGISHIKILVKKFEKEEKVIGYITSNNKKRQVVFLTKLGIYRCFYASRSPLAKMFRTFISNLLDHMINYESDLLRKISVKFKIDNPELIEQGMDDLQKKAIEYKSKYEEEHKQTLLLKSQCDKEIQKRIDTETEKTEVDIINSFNMMHIEQLKKEKVNHIDQIKNIKDSIISIESPDIMELRMIKEKYMKQVCIYILYPEYMEKLLHTKQKELKKILETYHNTDTDTEEYELDSNKLKMDSNVDLGIVNRMLKDHTSYKSNFENIFSNKNVGIQIEHDEILHFYLSYSRNVAKNNKLIYVNTQWVANRKHFNNMLNVLGDSSEKIEINKHLLFKTSLEEIGDIIREEFINLY